MIDSIYPGALKQNLCNVVPHSPFVSERCKPEIKLLISNMLKSSTNMVDQWTLPSWSMRPGSTSVAFALYGIPRAIDSQQASSDAAISESSYFSSRESSTKNLSVYSDAETCGTPEGSLENGTDACLPAPPPTILLRCNECVPVSKSGNAQAIARVDVTRECPLLGWNEYGYDLIRSVFDVPGHHFNLFAEENVSFLDPRMA